MKPSQPPESHTQKREDCAEQDREFLQQAVGKFVLLAQQVGVTPQAIISLLDSGLSVRDVLAFLESRRSGIA